MREGSHENADTSFSERGVASLHRLPGDLASALNPMEHRCCLTCVELQWTVVRKTGLQRPNRWRMAHASAPHVGIGRPILLAVVALVGVGCAPAEPAVAQHSASVSASVPGWHTTGAGCGGTAVATGQGLPSWADAGGGAGIPWAVGRPPEVVGVMFGTELVAKGERPDGSTNKILWLTRTPISSSQLTLRAQPADAATPVVTLRIAGAGYQQFPSIVDLPNPGCWRINISWGAGSTENSTFGLTVLPRGSLPGRS
jgi:hypothetical protein